MIVAVIPAKEPSTAKSRLATVLPADRRLALAKSLVENTLRVVSRHPDIRLTLMVAPESGPWDVPAGVRWVKDRNAGLNEAIADGIVAAFGAGATAVLILPTDLPFISEEAINQVLAPLDEPVGEPLVVIAPDRFCEGTNALLLRPPAIIRPAFGARSFERHQALARASGFEPRIVIDPRLSLDLDHPEDLRMLPASLSAALLSSESESVRNSSFAELRKNS